MIDVEEYSMEQEARKVKKKVTVDNVAKSIDKKPEAKKRKKKKSSPIVPILCLIIGILLGVIGTMFITDKLGVTSTDSVKDGNVVVQETDTKSTVEEMLEEDSFTIETPVVNMYYPSKWQEQIRVEQTEGDVYVVKFFGTVEGKEEQHLFVRKKQQECRHIRLQQALLYRF